MIWIADLICLVSLVQASWPSLAEIISRTNLCLGEEAHCPVNLYKDLDLCCKPLVCTVVPKTCTPNFFNRYFNISNYKDRRCMFPPNPTSITELSTRTEATESFEPSSKNYVSVTANHELVNDKFISTDSPKITNRETSGEFNSSDHMSFNKKMYKAWLKSEFNSETANESEEEAVNTSPTEGSLLNSMSYYIDSNNEIRRLVKRYISNNTSAEYSLSISPESLEGGMNYTFEQKSQTSNSSNENVYSSSSSSSSSSQSKTDGSQEYNKSFENGSKSGEIYDGDSNESLKETVQRNDTSEVNPKSPVSTELTTLAGSQEDWHSSDMKPDSRLYVFKVVTVAPSKWFQFGARVVKLNLSSEISE